MSSRGIKATTAAATPNPNPDSITNPSQGQVGEVISFGTSVFKFDEDYNILFATGKDETTGLYKYDKKFVGPQRNEFFVTHLGMNKNAYGLQNFPNK